MPSSPRLTTKLEHITVAQMREAAAAWRAEDRKSGRTSLWDQTNHDRVDDLIDEIARLRDREVVVSAVSPTLVWRNPAPPEDKPS